MPIPANVLIYGKDERLQDTRGLMLASKGYRVMAVRTVAQIDQLDPAEGIDLLMLCHTLSLEECGRAIAAVQSRWPKAKSLFLTSGRYGYHAGVKTETFDSMQGPENLLRTVSQIVRAEDASRAHAAS